jgi:hypothetical protein
MPERPPPPGRFRDVQLPAANPSLTELPPPMRIVPPPVQRDGRERLPFPVAILLLALAVFAGGFAAGRWSAPQLTVKRVEQSADVQPTLEQEQRERDTFNGQKLLIWAGKGRIETFESPRGGLVLTVGGKTICRPEDDPRTAADWRSAIELLRHAGAIELGDRKYQSYRGDQYPRETWRLTSSGYAIVERLRRETPLTVQVIEEARDKL